MIRIVNKTKGEYLDAFHMGDPACLFDSPRKQWKQLSVTYAAKAWLLTKGHWSKKDKIQVKMMGQGGVAFLSEMKNISKPVAHGMCNEQEYGICVEDMGELSNYRAFVKTYVTLANWTDEGQN